MTTPFFKTTSIGAAILIATCGFAGAQASQQQLQLVSANAQLTQNIDSKDAKQGQEVTAKLTSDVKNAGSVELPKGTLLIGQVDQVEPAKLSIVFNQAKLKDGRTVAIKATLLGAYPADDGEYFAQTGFNGSLTAQEPHLIPADQKTDQEPGLLGHVALHSDVASDTSGVFTSAGKNIDLKRGTEFQLAIAPEGTVAKEANGAD